MSYSIFKKIICPISKRTQGFTLVELMVVISIASIILGTVVIQQNEWSDKLAVDTQAYEMALMIRQAQIYSLAVREYTAGTGDKFDIGYGVFFDIANVGQYIYFADKNDSNRGKYNSGEDMEVKTFTRGVTLSKICGIDNGTEKCSNISSLAKLSISFLRPDPRAVIALADSSGSIISSFQPPASIYLKSLGDATSLVKVEANGQVSIVQ
jgi:prepilin-type N-terminal cleavage/methylation domain-containing protein